MKCSATAWLWAALIGIALSNLVAASVRCPACQCSNTRITSSTGPSQCRRWFTCALKVVHYQCTSMGVTTKEHACSDCENEWTSCNCVFEVMKHRFANCPTSGVHPWLGQAPS
ncbi:hypothetical protein PGTUg99_016564 [Puccinia graminis f. sp. tritici]|uniref:Uncharacterized protein n=1 Tax=Puccinia graminis f. sp. tritici TaxID=56615 RepID=A0A5B0PPF3_PUCGR|nr:hypothetical protein PGTUg99_016564 [Puccinia graminis f. sp. tritici]